MESKIDKILASFESVGEWQDIIGFLARLAKVFQAPLPLIPHRDVLSKRLFQCLNPILPTGVHQKALEVYSLMFASCPADFIEQVSLWSVALFSFSTYAAMSTKPALFNIIELHYLPHGQKLVICLKGLILCLLTVLEEPNNEFFERVF